MKKSDLKDGMVVECRDGSQGLVISNKILFRTEFDDFNDYTDNLKSIYHERGYDVVKIYDDREKANSLFYLLENPKNIIWERKDKEIDWSKVSKWTKVQVRNSEEQQWLNRYYLGLSSKDDKPYGVTHYDEFVYTNSNDCFTFVYKYIRLYDENDLKEEWLKD